MQASIAINAMSGDYFRIGYSSGGGDPFAGGIIDGVTGVAGLATMLRARNPQYTYADVVNSIKQGGRAVAALANKTTTGKAIDVMSSLAYINPPTGLTATVK